MLMIFELVKHMKSIVKIKTKTRALILLLDLFDTAPPLDLRVTLDETNNCTLTWQPPVIAKRHGNISEYFVNCFSKSFDNEVFNTSATAALLIFRPHAVYNCCVFAVNEIGLGDSACQTVTTYEAGMHYNTTIFMNLVVNSYSSLVHLIHLVLCGIVILYILPFLAPAAPPTSVKAHTLVNSTFLSWRPPLTQYRNGIIQKYYIEILRVNTTVGFNYTTEEPYLFISDLEQDVQYTCRVAAFTVDIGPFSELFIIENKSECVCMHDIHI